MRKLLVAVITLSALAACGDDDDAPRPDKDEVAKVQSCVAKSGHAVFSQDQYGNITYIACEL